MGSYSHKEKRKEKRNEAAAKCKSVREQHPILPDTPGDLTSPSKYF